MASSHRSENEEELASPLVVNINLNQTQVNSNASPVNVMKLRGSSFKRKTYCGMSENAGDIPSLKNMMTRNVSFRTNEDELDSPQALKTKIDRDFFIKESSPPRNDAFALKAKLERLPQPEKKSKKAPVPL